MLATDAASEGLNLQYHCRRVIHFELPWNPNRLEQRNGRVDRYGQSREPIIRYLYYPDSPEDDVLAALVQKIEQIARDRISTPDILGVLTGRGEFEEALVELDPEDRDVARRKSALVKLFEDRTEQLLRNVQPLFSASNVSTEEQNRILNLLNTSEPLLPDDLELERLVLEILGSRAKQYPDREGIFRIGIPLAYRSEGVKPFYPAVTFRRSLAIRYRRDEVDYITPLHPLVQALAADARRRLLQVYPSVRGLAPRRLSARLVDTGEPPSILFTFMTTVQGDGGLIEEKILAVRVDTQGQIIGDPEKNLCLLSTKSPGDVSMEKLNMLFTSSFVMLRERACQEISLWIKKRVDVIRRQRTEQARILRRDLEVDVNDRLFEIDEDEKKARGLIEETGQRRLFAEEVFSQITTWEASLVKNKPGAVKGPRGAYLEVDLEGLAEDEDSPSFAAFLRLFSVSNFIPDFENKLPIEEIENQSRDHAERVSEDLKGAVFSAAESMVSGLIADSISRGEFSSPLELDNKHLFELRDAALLALYRILFILYAEARDPRLEEHGIYVESFRRCLQARAIFPLGT